MILLALLPIVAPAHAGGRIAESEVHFDVMVGFTGASRSLGTAPFALTSGEPSGVAGVTEPFAALPFDDTLLIGPRWEARLVVLGLRGTLGYQRLYPSWEGVAAGTATVAGAAVPVSVRGLVDEEVRFGLGAELPVGLVSPYVDLVGDLHLVRTELAIDGQASSWRQESFSLSPRVGVRVQVGDSPLFVDVSGERGVLGPAGWGGQVAFGLAAFD